MNNTPKLVALADLHGHYQELIGLYKQLLASGFDPERDTLIQLGDVVDGGKDSRKVVEWCMDMAARYPHWAFLKGNHSDMLLDAVRYHSRTYGSFNQWWNQGGKQTALSYIPTAATAYERSIMQRADYIPKEHLDWLEARPLYHETDRYIFVHAGLRPGIPLAEQRKDDLLWIRDEFIRSPYDFGKRVIAGHTPMKEPLVMENKIMADTMSFERGKLTAVELSGDAPVFYFQEAVEGPWPASVRCRYSDPPNIDDYPF